MMKLANRVLKQSNGNEFYILAGKPINNGERFVYLMNPLGKEPNYSLWDIEFTDEENFKMCPYHGEDSEELIQELLEVFVENVHEVL